MISNSSKYAIRSVLFLSVHSDEQTKMSAKNIADSIEIPAPFLAKILQQLSKNKLISSSKGSRGGFYLTKKDESNTVLDIIYCIDGPDKFSNCFLGLSKCSDTSPCPVHHLVAPFRNNLLTEMGRKTIAELARESRNGKTFIFLETDSSESD